MNDFEKTSTEIQLLISKQLYMRFGQYRKSINFLEPFTRSNRSSNKGRRVTAWLITMYAAIFITCIVFLSVYYYQIEKLNKESGIIESKINNEDEARLNAELEEAEKLRDYYKEIKDIYESDSNLYGDAGGISAEILKKFTDAAGLNVNSSTIIYASRDNIVTIECETPELNVPVNYIKNLRKKFPDSDFEYSGYVVVNGIVKFTVQCRLPKQSEEE